MTTRQSIVGSGNTGFDKYSGALNGSKSSIKNATFIYKFLTNLFLTNLANLSISNCFSPLLLRWVSVLFMRLFIALIKKRKLNWNKFS